MKLKAKTTDAVSPLEEHGRTLARTIAQSGMVLLQNNGVLPLQKGNIALYGSGARHTVTGGSGSGEVNARHTVSFCEGLQNAGFTVTTDDWLDRYDETYKTAKQASINANKKKVLLLNKKTLAYLMSVTFKRPAGDRITETDVQRSDTDTCIYVLSRMPGEGHDEQVRPGSYLLTDEENANIRFCAANYRRFILVVNASFPLDLSVADDCAVGAILYTGLPGMESGTALADILTGKTTPEGRLAVTWANCYADCPSAGCFGTSPEVHYKEGTLTGYRWFATTGKAPRYPFGFGLSYTSFQTQYVSAAYKDNRLQVRVRVTNTGTFAGRDTVQLYASKTTQTLLEEAVRLCGFGKTKLLQPGETDDCTVSFDPRCLSVFDEQSHETVVKAGAYILGIGTDADHITPAAKLDVPRRIVLAKHAVSFPRSERVHEPVSYTDDAVYDLPVLSIDHVDVPRQSAPNVPAPAADLADSELLYLVCGSGLFGEKTGFHVPGAVGHTTARFLEKGIRNLEFCDGPAGLRLQRRSTVDKKGKIKPVDTAISLYDYLPGFLKKALLGNPDKEQMLYQFVTGFPAASVLAQTWDTALAMQMGEQVGHEMEEYGVDFWLAPAMNLVRDPLCGRNYEYYAEDPILTGLLAANVCLGVQKTPGKTVTIKHFACNNQETDRYHTSSELDEKTLRELYLKPFEIVVKTARPGAVMAAYNKTGGVYCANHKDLIEGVLRGEWGFSGIVMTDWLATGKGQADESTAINSGVDLIMPGGKGTLKALQKGLAGGTLDKDALRRSAARMLTLAKEE